MRGFRVPRIKTIPSEWLINFIRFRLRYMTISQRTMILQAMNPTEESEYMLRDPLFKEEIPIAWYFRGIMIGDWDLIRKSEDGGFVTDSSMSKRYFDDFEKLALRGHGASICMMLYEYGYIMDPKTIIRWKARYAFLHHIRCKFEEIDFSLNNMYIIGSEMEGYQEIWGSDKKCSESVQKCIDFYLDTVHKARVAALYAIWGLPIIRDVAKIIGRLIYASRGDVYLWNGQRAVVRCALSGPK